MPRSGSSLRDLLRRAVRRDSSANADESYNETTSAGDAPQRGSLLLEGEKETSEGSLRLHKLLIKRLRGTNGDSDVVWEPVRDLLEELAEDGTLHDDLKGRFGDLQVTFLQVVCMKDPPVDVVRLIVKQCPQSATWPNRDGLLPLHVACRYGASPEVVQVIAQVNRAAVFVVDNKGRLPLHYVFDPCSTSMSVLTVLRRQSSKLRVKLPKAEVIQYIVSEDLVCQEDNFGDSPLDLLSKWCKDNPPSRGKPREREKEMLRKLLSKRPNVTSTFLSSLQSFPRSLLEEALQLRSVQEVLNEKTASPVFSSLCMTEVIVHVILVICFTKETKAYASGGNDREVFYPITRLACMTYLSARTAIQMTEFYKIGQFKLWAKDCWNHLQIVNIFLLLATTFVSFKDPSYIDKYRDLVVVTGGMQWIALVSILRTMSIPFSVFVTGALHIIATLLPFLITTFLLLAAFGFMYFTLNFDGTSCTEGSSNTENQEDGLAFCSGAGSLMSVYVMFVGEIEEGTFLSNRSTMWLTVLFSFLMVILQLNVLIAVITHSYVNVKSRGEDVFWENRFYYLGSIDSLKRFFGADKGRVSSFCNKWYESSRALWDKTQGRISFDKGKKFQFQGSTMDLRRVKKWESYNYVLRFFLCLLIPLWLLAGLVTLGWLWPPQVREWLFCQRLGKTLLSPSLSPTGSFLVASSASGGGSSILGDSAILAGSTPLGSSAIIGNKSDRASTPRNEEITRSLRTLVSKLQSLESKVSTQSDSISDVHALLLTSEAKLIAKHCDAD